MNMNMNNVYVYSVHGQRDIGIDISKRVEVKDNIYVTLSPPGRLGYWNSGNVIINEIYSLYNLFEKYINSFILNSKKNNIYKNDLEYIIIKRLLSKCCKKYKTAIIDSIPFNQDPKNILMEKLYEHNLHINPLFNKEFFNTIKDRPEYNDDIVQIFNGALYEIIISEIINNTNYNIISRDFQYNFLYFMFKHNFIKILDTVDEIKLFYEYDELQKDELDYDYRTNGTYYYDKYLSYFKDRQDKPMNEVRYKYFNNLYKICKVMYITIANERYSTYIENYIKLHNWGTINIYDLLLYFLPLDIRIYKPGMTMPLLNFSPFHYRYTLDNNHQINTNLDKLGLYQLEKHLLPIDYDFFTIFPGSTPYTELINCADFGEIYEKYNNNPDLIYPTRDDFIKYGNCINGIFNCLHTIKDMIDDIKLKNKIIIISACAGFAPEEYEPEPALRRIMSDEQQGYIKYIKYKKKYLELKKKINNGRNTLK